MPELPFFTTNTFSIVPAEGAPGEMITISIDVINEGGSARIIALAKPTLENNCSASNPMCDNIFIT